MTGEGAFAEVSGCAQRSEPSFPDAGAHLLVRPPGAPPWGLRRQENFVTGRQREGAIWKAEWRLIPVRGSNGETPGGGTRGAMKTDRGSQEGQKISPQAVAEPERLRHKKTPTVGGG